MAHRNKRLRTLKSALSAAADSERAESAKGYMVSKRFLAYGGNTPINPTRFLGVASPERRVIVKDCLREHPFESDEDMRDTVATLWDGRKVREHGYAAMDLAQYAPAKMRRDLEGLELWERIGVEGAWWDIVDIVVARVDELLRYHRKTVQPLVVTWSRDEDFWRRRMAILVQLRAGKDVDLKLLERVIKPSLKLDQFFVQKAIGWSLRSAARQDPDWVRAFVAGNTMSRLAEREALKHLG